MMNQTEANRLRASVAALTGAPPHAIEISSWFPLGTLTRRVEATVRWRGAAEGYVLDGRTWRPCPTS